MSKDNGGSVAVRYASDTADQFWPLIVSLQHRGGLSVCGGRSISVAEEMESSAFPHHFPACWLMRCKTDSSEILRLFPFVSEAKRKRKNKKRIAQWWRFIISMAWRNCQHLLGFLFYSEDIVWRHLHSHHPGLGYKHPEMYLQCCLRKSIQNKAIISIKRFCL